MADNDSGERTEEATQTRRDEFRKRGQVAQTRELGSALVLLSFVMMVWLFAKFYSEKIGGVFQFSLGLDMVSAVRAGEIFPVVRFMGENLALLLLPALAISAVVGVASTFVQVGFLNVEDALAPKLEKLDPIQGFKRVFSMRSLVEGLKALAKIILVALVVGLIIKSEIIVFPKLINYSVEQLISYMGQTALKMFGVIGMVMLALAAADYFFQRWDLEKKMMMTKQEIKEENKTREGDPLIKARIRRVQRELSNKRMMEAVPKADVIITNPTHIAVALKYDANLPAPQIIAKGADLIAEKIKSIAREHGVPIIENKPLARTIYKTIKIGQVIPRELFVAVAEVLSYVYRLKKKVSR